MQGLHLTADLRGCSAGSAVMCDVGSLRACCLAAVAASGLTVVGELFHGFESSAQRASAGPAGITGVVLLAESHLAVHTWPELAAVTLDVFVCNRGSDNSTHARALFEALMRAFAPARIERHTLQRGRLDLAA